MPRLLMTSVRQNDCFCDLRHVKRKFYGNCSCKKGFTQLFFIFKRFKSEANLINTVMGNLFKTSQKPVFKNSPWSALRARKGI